MAKRKHIVAETDTLEAAPAVETHEASHSEDYSEPAPDETLSQIAAESEATPESEDANDFEPPENERAVVGSNSDNAKEQRRKLLKKVFTIGEVNGKGATSLVALAETVVTGACDDAFKLHDAKAIYESFRKGKVKAAGTMDVPEKSEPVQVSKLGVFIRLGLENDRIIESDGVITNAMDLFHTVKDKHVQYLKTDESKRLRLRSTYEALLSVSRAQIDKAGGKWLTEDQIDGLLMNDDADKKDKTAIDILKDALNLLEKARNGKADTAEKAGRAPLQHENLDHAIGHTIAVIAEFEPEFMAERDAKAKAAAEKAAKGA